jgi:photosystem II stability/assembly factor-like uncharacterized protein
MPGPTGGEITALLASGGLLYAGASSGSVFVSVDQGRSWRESRAGLPAMEINSLAASGTNLYAGTERGGVYRSTDQGQSWADVTSRMGEQIRVNALAVSGATLFAGTVCGILRSTDQGQSWETVNAGLTSASICELVVSGTALFTVTCDGLLRSTDQGRSCGASLFARTEGLRLHRSEDHGKTRMEVTLPTEMRADSPKMRLRSLAASKTAIFLIVAEDVEDIVGLNRVYRSTDLGRSWEPTDWGSSGWQTRSFVISGTDIFVGAGAGVYRSTDDGQSWEAVNEDLDVIAFAISGRRLYAGTHGRGVFLSTDRGQSWREINPGLAKPFVNSLAVSGTNLFAGTTGGVFRLSISR